MAFQRIFTFNPLFYPPLILGRSSEILRKRGPEIKIKKSISLLLWSIMLVIAAVSIDNINRYWGHRMFESSPNCNSSHGCYVVRISLIVVSADLLNHAFYTLNIATDNFFLPLFRFQAFLEA